MLSGIDVSNNNGPGAVTEALAQSSFVIVKAHEGLSWVDPRHAALVGQARNSGKLVGHYSFAWTTFDAATCARNFLAAAAPRPGEVVALDLEHGAEQTTWSHRLAWTLTWLATVKKATGASPFLYVNDEWLRQLSAVATRAQWQELTTYPLWLAVWNGRPGVLSKAGLHGWPCWTVHQYADGPLADRNVFAGTADTWFKLAVPGHPSTTNKPAPVPLPTAPKPAATPPAPSAQHLSLTVPGLAHSVTVNLEPAK